MFGQLLAISVMPEGNSALQNRICRYENLTQEIERLSEELGLDLNISDYNMMATATHDVPQPEVSPRCYENSSIRLKRSTSRFIVWTETFPPTTRVPPLLTTVMSVEACTFPNIGWLETEVPESFRECCFTSHRKAWRRLAEGSFSRSYVRELTFCQDSWGRWSL